MRRLLGRVPALGRRLGLPRGALGWATGLLALVAVALLVLALVQLSSVRSHDELGDRRRAATRAASSEITTLLTTDTKSSKQNIAALQAGATAGFRKQLVQFAGRYLSAISQNAVTSTGTVDAAAPVSVNGARDTAVVIVAASASVKNRSSATAQQANYRFTVTMNLVGGRWLVADLQLAP